MKNEVIGGIYANCFSPAFIRGVLPGLSRTLKAEQHDASVVELGGGLD